MMIRTSLAKGAVVHIYLSDGVPPPAPQPTQINTVPPGQPTSLPTNQPSTEPTKAHGRTH